MIASEPKSFEYFSDQRLSMLVLSNLTLEQGMVVTPHDMPFPLALPAKVAGIMSEKIQVGEKGELLLT
jgi:hypothetical protein